MVVVCVGILLLLTSVINLFADLFRTKFRLVTARISVLIINIIMPVYCSVYTKISFKNGSIKKLFFITKYLMSY